MIQFNLLPDVKVQFIKAKKAKRTVMVVAFLSVAVSIGVLIIMVSATFYQKHRISDLDGKITDSQKTLQNTPNLAKILTIQNQLDSLTGLYAKRPVTSRLFGYIQQTTPTQIHMSHMTLDYTASTMKIDGTADKLESVNTYVDTLKFTTFSIKGNDKEDNAFSGVVLSTFSRDSKVAAFTISLTFNPDIFDYSKEVTMKVPKTITTRSETELPGSGVFDTKGSN